MPKSPSPEPSEQAFTDAVLEAAKWWGWLAHHCRPARRADGRWSTPISGDPGFPDLILAHPGAGLVLAAELKVGKREPTAAQAAWLAALDGAGVAVVVWYPSDWVAIHGTLALGRARVEVGHAPPWKVKVSRRAGDAKPP